MKTYSKVQAGVHWFFNISRQISPVLGWILGWKTFVLNFITGGVTGYEFDIWQTISKFPSWYGVPIGPLIQPDHSCKLFSLG